MKVKIRLCEPGGVRTAAQTWLRSQGPWKEIPLHSCLLWLNQFWVNMLRFAIYIYNYTNINIWWLLLGQATHHGSNQIPSASSALRPPSWCDGGGSWWNVGHDAAKSFGSEFMVYPWVPVPPKNGRDGRNGLNESSLWCSFIVELVFFIARSS